MTNWLKAQRALWGSAVFCLALPARAQSVDAPSAQRGRVETAVYGGAGTTFVGSNEVEDIYDDRHFGLGLLASFPASQAGTEQPRSRGFMWLLGLTAERRSLRAVLCGYGCQSQPKIAGFANEADLGIRAGAGSDGHWVGFRAGLLLAGGIHARVAERLLFPDVALRVGPRELGFFTLGLGAYNASTSLRPGLYAGVSFVPLKSLVGSLHYGYHFNDGSLGDTVFQLDSRLDFAVDYALSRKLSVGLSVALLPSGSSESITEGCATVGVGI